MNQDLRRLSKLDRLRHHIRRNDHTKASALALRLIDEGSDYTVESEAGEARPLFHRAVPDWLDVPVSTPRWVRLSACLIPALWDEARARLFACACAESVLHVFEAAYPDDIRPRHAIDVARRYAMGQASSAELRAAYDSANASYTYAPHQAPAAGSAAAHYAAASPTSTAYAVRSTAYAVRSAAYHTEDVIEPLLLRHMLLPIEELTRFDEEDAR